MSTLDTIKAWVREKMGAAPALPPANVHTPAPDQPDGLTVQFPEKEKPDSYLSISGNRPAPTAEWLEKKRIDREAFEKKWDIGLD